MSAAKTGHAGRRDLLGDQLQGLRLAGPGGAGDQAVAVEEPERQGDVHDVSGGSLPGAAIGRPTWMRGPSNP